MIKHDDLNRIWNTIKPDLNSSYYYKRVDNKCIPDLCVGLNTAGHRSLILELPEGHGVDFQPVIRKNLVLKIHDQSLVVLELKTSDFKELFCDLIISLYQSIYKTSGVKEYCSIFISTFHKWSDFFSGRDCQKLSDDAVKGIFGELVLLVRILEETAALNVDASLSSWRGPYDTGKDFVFDDLDVEVKTKGTQQIGVTISSEFQLDPEPGKGLQLCVVSVDIEPENGLSIEDMAFTVRDLVVHMLGDISLFRNALWQKGLTLENLNEYNYLRFRPRALATFDAAKNEFPSLISSDLSPALSKLKYQINLTQLDDYLIEETKL